MAHKLGHEAIEGQGEDARDENNEKAEYKCQTGRNGSWQFHWLSEEKIKEYESCTNVYLGIKEGPKILEILKIPMKVIFPYLKEKADIAIEKMKILNEGGIYKKKKNIDAHKSFSLGQMTELGAVKVYDANE